jgi:hypothetical protein
MQITAMSYCSMTEKCASMSKEECLLKVVQMKLIVYNNEKTVTKELFVQMETLDNSS